MACKKKIHGKAYIHKERDFGIPLSGRHQNMPDIGKGPFCETCNGHYNNGRLIEYLGGEWELMPEWKR